MGQFTQRAIALLAIACFNTVAFGQTIIHVDDDAPPNGDGATWNAAFTYLQDGLDAAEAVVMAGGTAEMRVAQGTYKPDQDEAGNVTPGDREASFTLVDDTSILGGWRGAFDGSGMNPDDRDVTLFETILSGDLSGNDESDFANYEENSYHVLVADQTSLTTTLDGITVRSGSADGKSSLGTGGGLFGTSASLTISNCRFEMNRAGADTEADGGAMSLSGGELHITNCTFQQNRCTNIGGAVRLANAQGLIAGSLFQGNEAIGPSQGNVSAGAAIAIFSSDSFAVSTCTFNQNSADSISKGDFGGSGGAIVISGSEDVLFDSCDFASNSCTVSGGAIAVWSSHGVVFDSCEMNDNETTFGIGNVAAGGAAVHAYSTMLYINCMFDGNSSDDRGGAIYNSTNGQGTLLTLDNCVLSNNTALSGGAFFQGDPDAARTPDEFFAVACTGDTEKMRGEAPQSIGLIVIGSTFDSNAASDEGGAIAAMEDPVTIIDSDFLLNSAFDGGALYVPVGSADIRESTFSGNSAFNGPALSTGGSDNSISNCVFSSNSGCNGGSIRFSAATATVSSCAFVQNETCNGGGIQAVSSSVINVDGSLFFGNQTVNGGAVVATQSSSVAMSNCIMAANTASVGVGALFVCCGSNSTLVNCSIAGNSSPIGDGVQVRDPQSELIVTNSIIRRVSTDAILQQDGATVDVSYSNISGGWPGDGNIDADPLFVDADGPDDIPGTEDDDLHLMPGSPCINAGTNSAPNLPALDIDGEPRIQHCIVDMGADETPIFTDCNNTGTADVCDLQDGTSTDFDGSGIPDECEYPGLFTGADGASWFEPTNWAAGTLPDAMTDVFIPVNVLVDQPGALAQNVIVLNGGTLTFVDGSLNAQSIDINAGGTITGEGDMAANVTNNGVLAPGAPVGELNIIGDYTQTSSARLELDIDAMQPLVDYDRLSVNGTAVLGGQLRPTIAGVFVALDDSYDFLTASETTGTFSVVFTVNLPGGRLFQVVYPTPRGPASSTSLLVVALNDLIDFDPPSEFNVGGIPSDAAVGDFNEDMFIDLAVSAPSIDTVFILLNQGNDMAGTWNGFTDGGDAIAIAVGMQPSALSVGEFDGINGVDLAVANVGDDNVQPLLNDGTSSGELMPQPPIAVGDMPFDMVAADLFGDASLDLAVTNRGDGTISLLQGAGDGTFAAQPPLVIGPDLRGLAAGNFGGDPANDLIVTRPDPGSASAGFATLVVNQGGGVFGMPLDFPVGDDPTEVDPEDIDNDKDSVLDVLVVNEGSGDITIMLNDATNGFGPPISLPVGGTPTSLDAFPMDDDLDSDLAIAVDDPVDGRLVRIFRNDTVGDNLAFVQEDEDEATDLEPLLVLSGDVNQDNLIDLIVVNETTAPGARGAISDIGVLLNSTMPVPPCPADFDEDGVVNVTDLIILLATWGPCESGPGCLGDITDAGGNGPDGVVNVHDLIRLLSDWGLCL